MCIYKGQAWESGLNLAAKAGNLADALHQALAVQHDGATLALRWIVRHPTEFRAGIDDPEEFLRKCLDDPSIRLLLTDPEALDLIPLTKRADFVQTVVRRHGPPNAKWLYIASQCGFADGQLADILLQVVDRADVAAFFVGGNEGVYRNATFFSWSLLNDTQFLQALDTIARHAPAVLFDANFYQLERRLPRADLHPILVRAAENLPSLQEVNVDALIEHLDADTLGVVARNLNGGSLEFLIRTAIMLGYDHDDRLFERYFEQFPVTIETLPQYWRLAGVQAGSQQQEMARAIREQLKERVRNDGIAIARISRDQAHRPLANYGEKIYRPENANVISYHFVAFYPDRARPGIAPGECIVDMVILGP